MAVAHNRPHLSCIPNDIEVCVSSRTEDDGEVVHHDDLRCAEVSGGSGFEVGHYAEQAQAKTEKKWTSHLHYGRCCAWSS
jgi:hypothetical protein